MRIKTSVKGAWIQSIENWEWDSKKYICASGLQRHVLLPANLQKLDIVFTKKPCSDSFDIRRGSDNHGNWFGHLPEVPELLAREFEYLIEEAWIDGYRYVHFEY